MAITVLFDNTGAPVSNVYTGGGDGLITAKITGDGFVQIYVSLESSPGDGDWAPLCRAEAASFATTFIALPAETKIKAEYRSPSGAGKAVVKLAA